MQHETETLDHLIALIGLPRVDFIKIDVEGAEPEVLEGAVETIRRHAPKLALAVYHRRDEEEKIRQLFNRNFLRYAFSYRHLRGRGVKILFARSGKLGGRN